MPSLFYFFFFNIFIQAHSLDFKIEYQNEDDPPLEEYISSSTKEPESSSTPEALHMDPNQQIKQSIEKFGVALCSFPEESLKTSPTLTLYCTILAILWLFLVITLAFGYIRQIIDRIRSIRDGFYRNRANSMGDEESSISLPGMFSIGQTAHNQQVPPGNDSK